MASEIPPDTCLTDYLANEFAPPERTVPPMLARQAERHGDKPLVSSAGRTWTYAQTFEQAAQFGATLRSAGINAAIGLR
jgi:carnitine-CoA ligase